MSYILDALEKSEKERGSGAVLSLKSNRSQRSCSSLTNWFVVCLAVVLMAVAVLGARFLWQTAFEPPSTNLTIQDLKKNPMQLEPDSRNTMHGGAERTQQYQQHEDLQNPVAVSDLDPSMQSRLPDLSINALSYSTNQTKRFVMINQSIFKEGDDLGNGISIEEITSSAIILNFESMRIIMQP